MIATRFNQIAGLFFLGAITTGCVHMKGVVLEEPSNRPLTTAKISIGRPGGIAVFETHDMDKNGAFDFFLLPTDANNVYLYDGAGDPQMTLRHLDERQLNDKMHIMMRPARPNMEPGRDYIP